MSEYHGKYKRKNYFEGWYFKCQNEGNTIALIPGIHMDKDGRRFAFVQAIGPNGSHWFAYPYEAFSIDSKNLCVTVGENVFSKRGMRLRLSGDTAEISGEVQFGEFTPIAYDIMGPFAFVPFMECRHGVVSMHHLLQGRIDWNGQAVSFSGGQGYIEKDWGVSFPSAYLWTQCSQEADIMAAIAAIPFCGLQFTGCICAVRYRGKEYRLATYLGGRALRWGRDGFELKQGKYSLTGSFDSGDGYRLAAPQGGEMIRTVHENAACFGRYRFYEGNNLLFDIASNQASFEFSDAARR